MSFVRCKRGLLTFHCVCLHRVIAQGEFCILDTSFYNIVESYIFRFSDIDKMQLLFAFSEHSLGTFGSFVFEVCSAQAKVKTVFV